MVCQHCGHPDHNITSCVEYIQYQLKKDRDALDLQIRQLNAEKAAFEQQKLLAAQQYQQALKQLEQAQTVLTFINQQFQTQREQAEKQYQQGMNNIKKGEEIIITWYRQQQQQQQQQQQRQPTWNYSPYTSNTSTLPSYNSYYQPSTSLHLTKLSL